MGKVAPSVAVILAQRLYVITSRAKQDLKLFFAGVFKAGKNHLNGP